MATAIVKHQYDGYLISQRADGFVNLTQMALACNRPVTDYFRTQSTYEYLCALSVDLGIESDIPKSQDLLFSRLSAVDYAKMFPGLVFARRGAPETGGGAWAHPEVAIDFAQWVSIPFRVWANRTLRQVITQASKFDRILDVAVPGSPIFEKRFEQEVARVTGWHKNDIRNGKFYWEFVYYWLTPAEREKLDIINPPLPSGRRRLRIHDCLDSETKARLAPFQLELLGRLKSCKDNGIAELRRMIQRELGCGGQLNIFDDLGI